MTKLSEWWWAALELVLGLASWVIGFRVAYWVVAKPISELPASASLPAGCTAFRYDHNAYFCEALGTTQSRPLLFIGVLLVMAISFSLALYIHFSGRAGKLSLTGRIMALVKAKLA